MRSRLRAAYRGAPGGVVTPERSTACGASNEVQHEVGFLTIAATGRALSSTEIGGNDDQPYR